MGPSARFQAARDSAAAPDYHRGNSDRTTAGPANEATAYRPLRKFAAFRYPLRKAHRGSNAPLDAAEREEAMADVTRDVYAASTVGPMSAKVRTILSFS